MKKSDMKKIDDKMTKEEIEEIIGENTKKAKKDAFLDIAPYLIIIFFVVIIRLFIATPVKVNGTSMYPTLHHKDYMILYKLKKKIKGIKRFDIVVIDKKDGKKIIKRVIGMPGDTVKYQIRKDEEGIEHGILLINGEEIEENFLSEEAKLATCSRGASICKEEIIVKENEYFVMGDNRGNSEDSRRIGNITDDEILGQAELIIYPFNRFGNVK